MVLTQRRLNGTGDLPSFVQEAMGMGAKVPIKKPAVIMSIAVDQLTITMQNDGQIAIFNPLGLIGCECQGTPVLSIPDTADLKAVLRDGDIMVIIFREGEQFYSKRQQKFTALKVYDPTIKADRKSDPLSENDEDGGCVIWHTNDDSTIDYDRQIKEDTGEDFPLPRWGQPGQHDDDPKEGR